MNDAAAPPAVESGAPSQPSHPQQADQSARFFAILSAAAFLLFWQIAPRVHTDSVGAILISTIISLALVVWFPAEFARAFKTAESLAASMALSAVIILPIRFTILGPHPPLPWSLLERVPGLVDLIFIWFAASIGATLSHIVRGVNMIPPVAAVLALVDIWTVLFGGPVNRMLHSTNPLAQAVTKAMTVRLPGPTAVTVGAAPIQVVGFADFLFIAFFIAALCRHTDMRITFRKTVWGLVIVLCSYMIVVFFSDWHLPALVPMSVVMIGLHWRQFHYERSEAFALIYAGVFILLIAAGFWYFGRLKAAPYQEPTPVNPALYSSVSSLGLAGLEFSHAYST